MNNKEKLEILEFKKSSTEVNIDNMGQKSGYGFGPLKPLWRELFEIEDQITQVLKDEKLIAYVRHWTKTRLSGAKELYITLHTNPGSVDRFNLNDTFAITKDSNIEKVTLPRKLFVELQEQVGSSGRGILLTPEEFNIKPAEYTFRDYPNGDIK